MNDQRCYRDATGKEGVPFELLILGALRYIGRGWTFDDLEESTNISLSTHRQFFHTFIQVGATERSYFKVGQDA